MCCNSQLRFPLSVSRFRCTVCDTINDLRPQRFNGETPQPLTLQRIKLVVAQCKQASGPSVPFVTTQNAKGKRDAQDGAKPPPPGWEPLVKMVEEVFQNWESLNASFTNGQEVTLDDTGVALDQVREAYRILLDSPVNVIHAMMLSTDKILRRPGRLLCRKEDIKFLMIILENPLLSQHAYQQESHHHHNIMKHVFGLLSCLSNELHHYLVNWFARLNLNVFRKRVELVNSFTTHYLAKAQRAGRSFPAAYESDWRVISAARVMALMFAANNQSPKIPISEFYNTMVDYVDLVADYDSWQQRSGKFAFCQYPFLISMGSKMSVMELDARRQMETKVKEAILTILYQKRVTVPYLVLRVRRDNLIVDSLTQLAQHETDLKKSLKIEFSGEEGIDAGGLRKEWFQLLVRELFGPQYGMFTWDEDTNLCWFNPASFEASDQYYLVGVVIGLAIYNSTILDIHLPLPCYKKLLNIPVGLDDLKVFRPALARGLEQLLTFEGDVETTFCRDFVGEYEAFGEIVQVPLVPGGEKKPVTNENRVEYVQRYVKFILNDSIAKQFEPFMRGFYNVCGGNALSLFRPEEIELLVRGSDEPLEVEQLRAVTEYYGFNPDDETIRSFWAIFGAMAPKMQRKLLTFVTGSDRIPATGTANMTFKITCLGEDSERFPTAHTCFNQICLYRYRGRAKLERKLLTAINESQGFYFK
ncbi:hypothetical protein BC938DRAFT_471542 [Jimgerdemannia flammicorona]|uniref:HECT-type E3 ubiquitin transferase n=1 Tax=Jimgerdemannia flammicorona TaxID=994334 RepID=A0A433Q7X4_9FUNG|nr:hypothetical protein BC938DRAFT_471542 [Jimgerdemannia flammicorona]